MQVDGTIGFGSAAQAAIAAADAGYDGVWTAETNHDPFFPIVQAAAQEQRLTYGTGIAVAFARSPMNLAQIANDVQLLTEGRFMLGLGSQIRAHITRRFSMPWSQPAARMRELILAMHAIWDCWSDGTKLDFRGDFYEHTLMTPFFDPGPNPFGKPRVFLAGVGPKMTEVAGEVCEGFLCHPFTTETYLREETLPALTRGAARAGRSLGDLELSLSAFIVTGADEAAQQAAADAVRGQIAFYASTPAYRPVLDKHGWGDAHGELNRLSKEGRWAEMGALIDDEMLHAFAVVAEPDRVGAELLSRYGDVLHRLSFYAPYAVAPGTWEQVITDLKTP